jgi:hypothetical protein
VQNVTAFHKEYRGFQLVHAPSGSIADIRLYGTSGFQMLSDVYGTTPLLNNQVTKLFAFKLRERGFRLSPSADHLYIYLSEQAEDKVQICGGDRIVSLKITPLAQELLSAHREDKFVFLVQLVKSAIQLVRDLDEDDLATLDQTADELLNLRNDVEITQCSLDTDLWTAAITFKINGEIPGESQVFFKLVSKTDGAEHIRHLINVSNYRHVFELAKELKSKDKVVKIIPKNSTTAKQLINKYSTFESTIDISRWI